MVDLDHLLHDVLVGVYDQHLVGERRACSQQVSESGVPHALAALELEVYVGGLHAVLVDVEYLYALPEAYCHIEGQRMHIQTGRLLTFVEYCLPGQHLVETYGRNMLVFYCLYPLVGRKDQNELTGGQHTYVQDLLGQKHGV